MESLRALFKIGRGPSSSHTMGPYKAVMQFKEKYSVADYIEIYLYGSLALTGKGHLTDKVIDEALETISHQIIFDTKKPCKVHPNTMECIAYQNKKEIGRWTVYSVGGGTIEIEGVPSSESGSIYPLSSLTEIKQYCKAHSMDYFAYVQSIEPTISSYLEEVWEAMQKCIEKGLQMEGLLPGPLEIPLEAKYLYQKALKEETNTYVKFLSAYAYAVGEVNACGGTIVTAPTCGAAGVLPASLYYLKKQEKIEDKKIIGALAVAGLFGNLIKTNASISGAECGCQAEVGSASAMAAAAIAHIRNLSLEKIEDAAEVAMENHLGLTCDPIYGLVQIPCIQRNAAAAMRSFDAVNLTDSLEGKQKISFDMVVDTMYETGKDLSSHYRETSTGGLAKKYCKSED
ncbi:MAG: L-serine ammonia-lyase, iron-sulfur-dependent, subunit alpha [Bacilli bacterium]|nr:L-serine ammonia-lyase, iron-sulfur-dependent, subunit alpha [Bacilli bacterium]